MRNKWFRRIRRFIELFTPGGVEYSSIGTEIHITSRGAMIIPTSEYAKIIAAHIEETRRALARIRPTGLPKDG